MDFNAPPEPPVFDPAPPPPTPWPLWPTIGFSIGIAGIALVAQIFAAITVVGIMMGVNGSIPDAEQLAENGALLGVATCASAPVVVGLVFFLAWLRRGISLDDYLQLRWPSARTMLLWLGGLLGFVLVSDSLTFFLGRPVVPPFMVEAYNSAGLAMPFLMLGLLLGAPFAEEFLFRGFLFTGLQHSRLGTVGASIITSVVWAVIHLQYDWYGMLTLVVGGLFLAAARVKTGSLWTCVILHSVMNVIATTETILLVKGIFPGLGG
jgi:membrane protease YdiL (CAAX protease family)